MSVLLEMVQDQPVGTVLILGGNTAIWWKTDDSGVILWYSVGDIGRYTISEGGLATLLGTFKMPWGFS